MRTQNKGTRSSRFRITAIAIAVASSFAMTPAWAADTATGSGSGVAYGTGSDAPKAENVAIGPNAKTDSTHSVNTGEAGIAIGANAKTITEVGRKGAAVVFMDPLSYLFHTGNFGAGGIAIGKNSIGYNGSTVLGQHDYTGQIGDVNVNKQGDASNSYENLQYGFGATSVGYNSYTAGQYATSIGAYNVNSANYYPGGTNTVNGNSTVSQGFGATIIGSFNSNESRSSQSAVSGMANSLVGVANRVSNSSGALVFGAANQITNSLQNDDTLSRTPILPSSPVEFADTLRELVSQSNGGGSTLAIGGANTADWTNETAIIGVENSITGTAGNVSTNNMVNGYANKASNVNNVSVIGSENSITNTNTAVVVGDKRTLTGADNSVIIGSSSNGTTTSVKNAVAIGTESNATVEGGVALGAGSVASTDKGKVGYDPGTKAASTNTDSTWVSTRAAVSIGDTANGITRQITGLAAGTADTDAVNVAQLKVVKGDASQAVTESKKHSSVVAGNNIKVTSQANAEGGTEYSVSTSDNVSFSSVTVGAASISQAGIQAGSQKITNVAPGTISATSTDAVNGSQLYQTNQAVQQNSDDISKLYNRSAELNRKIHRAGAHAAALAALHPLDFDENHRVSASLGLGQYHSSGAAALGIFVRPTENFMVSLGGSIASGSDLMGNLGVHYRFGGDSVRVNKTELTQQVSTLTAENRDLSAKLASSNSKLEAATSKIDSLMERIHAIEAKLNMK